MLIPEKSRWQQEFDALPEWAQKMVRGLAGCAGYGFGGGDHLLSGMSKENREKHHAFHIILERRTNDEWFDGFLGMRELAGAMTAPWPPPAAPSRERRVFNIVELAADAEGEDDCAFDQPCCFGHRVESHAVYCHNEAWPDSPRKCRRNRDDYRHEDCPGFVLNPDHKM